MATDYWFIGGGASHTQESARRLTYASTGGSEGVGAAKDLKVLPLAPSGGGVRVTVGTGTIRSRYAGGETQSYLGTVYQQEEVAVAPTGSSARSDLIILRVEDPFAAGSPWPPPVSVENGPYVFVRVVSGVPAGTRRVQSVVGHENDTAITLARVDIPASTSGITSAHIVDLRSIAQPRSSFWQERVNAPNEDRYLTSATPVQFPAVSAWVPIPEWATHAWLGGSLNGIAAVDSAVSGTLNLRFGTINSSATQYNEQSGFGSRISYPLGSKVAIPESIRGTSVQLTPYGQRSAGTGRLRSTWGTFYSPEVRFIEEPE